MKYPDAVIRKGAVRLALASFVAGQLWFFGCSGDSDDCDLIGAPVSPMLTITVLDSVTGAPAWWGASGTIEDGAFRENLVAQSTEPGDSTAVVSLFSQTQREGVYTFTIKNDGYAVWVMSGLEVRDEGCFLTSYWLEARLQRALSANMDETATP